MADGTTSTLTNPVTGTGTTNYVPKFTGTSSIGNGQIIDNGSSGVNVGAKLLLRDDGPFITGPNIANVTGNFAIGTSTSASLQLFTNSSNRLHITSGGDLGIGTQSPSGKLHIKGGNGSNLYVDNNNEQFTQMFFTRNGVVNNGVDFLLDSSAKDFGIRTLAAIPFYISTAATAGTSVKRMTVTSAGDVGIGNTSPSYKLDITGTLRNTTGAAFATSSGNVLIGTTTDASIKLDVNGTFRATGNSIVPGWTFQTNGLQLAKDSLSSLQFKRTIDNNANFQITPVTYQGLAALRFNNFGGSESNFWLSNGRLSFAGGTTESMTLVGSELYVGHSGSPSDNGDFKLQISGNAYIGGRIRATTIDSTGTGTAMNILYADATGVIKKAAVPSGGSGTVTSITAGTGLTGGTITTSGTIAVDTASIATRARVQKGVDSVAAISVKGTGISGYFPKWTGTGTQDTSQLFQLGQNIGIGTATPIYRIHLPDAGNTANQAMLAGTIFGSDGNGQTIVPGGNAMTLYGQGSDGFLYGAQVSGGKWGVNTRTLDATLNVDGNVKIVTVDSTSTARNMLYQDANGIIKKSAVPSGGVSGSGTTSYLPKWTSGTGLGNSAAYDNGGEIIINSTSDAGDFKLQVVGNIYTSGTITTASPTADPVKPWKLGSRQAAAVSLDSTQYLEVEVNGTYYRLAIVTPD
jgi:hypothetical protein